MSFTGNSSYVGLAATSIEQSVRDSWSMVWTAGHPLISAIFDQKMNFNKGFEIKGKSMLLAVMGDDQTNPVAGVASGASELSAMTYNTGNGLSQFNYNFGHYRGNYTILESEKKLNNNARGNLLEAKKMQVIGSYMNALSNHLSSATADASNNSRILGLYQPLSTSNTVGGISQTTDPQIAAYVKTGAGAFTLQLVDDALDAIRANTNLHRNVKPDLALASYAAGNNVYGYWKSAIAPAQRLMNVEFQTKYGIENYVYQSVMVAQENRIANTLSGSVALLSTATWFAYIQKEPTFAPLQRIPATDAYEQVITGWNALGTNDPGMNGLLRDLTA